MGDIEAELLAALEQAAQAAQTAEDDTSKASVAAAVAAATDAANPAPPRSGPELPAAGPATATPPPSQTPSAAAESRSLHEPTPSAQPFAERPPPLHQASEPPPAQPRADVTPSTQPPRPTSAPQEIKTVIKHESPPPGEASRSLLKRSRSPVPESDRGDEKRIKTDVDDQLDGVGAGHADTDLDELARMIQNAESSVDGPLHLDEAMLDIGSQLNPSLDANFGGVLHGIPDSEHSKMVDSILASLSQHDMGTDYLSAGSQHHTDPDGSHDIAMSEAPPKKRSLWSNHEHYTRQAQILPTLGRVAVDILRALSEQTLEDTIATLNTESESPIWKEYLELKSFFDTLRKMFSDDFPLLFPDQLEGINSPEEHEMVRVANLATMCASMFGLNELGWPDLNNNFLQNFLAKSCPMTAAVSDLCLVFKTQMFFGLAESNPEASREELLEELFVTGVKDTLQQRHPDIPLTAVENQFLAKSEQRKTMLLEGSHSPEAFQVLTTSYTYEAFLDSLSTHINDCMGTIEKLGTGQPGSAPTGDDILLHEEFGHDLGSNFDLDAVIAEASKAAETAVDSQEDPVNFEELAKLLTEGISRHGQDDQTNSVSEMPQSVASNHENANRVTRLALDHIHHNQYRPTASPQPSSYANSSQLHPSYQAPQQQSQTQQPYYQYNQQAAATAQNSHQTTPSNDTLPPNQSDSTPALYERARQAAAARSSTHARREGSHSTRRPWSAEEEKALMMGLDMVKGPHWSQILSLFGPSGSMSQILADRTQVQLKDKARNLKLFFLKTNSEMPYYLQCVTGELKTRAPTQAARKEAEERARLNSQDEQDRINGIMALGNMQGQRAATAVTAQRSVTPATSSQSNHGLPHAHGNMARTGQAQAGTPVQGHTGAQGIARTSTAHPAHYPRPAQPQPGQSQAYTQSPAQQNQQHPQQQPPRPPQGQPQGPIAGQTAPRPQGQGQPQGVPQGQGQAQAAGHAGGQAAARPPTQGQPQGQAQGHVQNQQSHGQPQGQAQRQIQGQAPTQAQGQAAQGQTQGQAVQGQAQGQGQLHGQHQNHAQGQVQPQQQARPQGQTQARPQYPVQHPGQPSQQQQPQSHYQQHRPQPQASSQPQTQQQSPVQQQHMQQNQRPQQPAQAHATAGASQQQPRPQQNVQAQGQMQRAQTQPQAQASHQAPQGQNHQRHHSQPQPQPQAQSQGQGQGQAQHPHQHQAQQQSVSQHQQPSHQAPRQVQPQQPQQQQQQQQHGQQAAYRQPAQQHAASQAAPRPMPQAQQPVQNQAAQRPNGQQPGPAQASAPTPAPAPAVKEEPVKHELMDPDEAHLLPIKEALEREARESSGAHSVDHEAHMEPEALAALIAASVSGA